ncbi:MAG: Ni/Fe hydrogenase subunit alpha [Acidobacteria bacterium]|nr:Ni/Fe hydrogenase subunit alpha [Acidobacteriota bacterium]MBU4331326.1 Ni/Fe hydrogenase subunit alpha [Acidobacteriota bacterium]MBU4495076.1 Ni/Fe hydrogenase subunit alpha [Acidobacteriota bacterium]MCG2815683.1 Ni/Fe hydrogenase subunit alpha [Candidatus Aminicenantes bacterium]
MSQRITIDPITRLEGHGKIEIFLDDKGDVDRAILQIPELRGFEQFAVGRPAEEMPRITPRICGVCPTAHHMASTKACDAVWHVTPPPAGRMIRELIYNTFQFEDHTLHFFFLGGPDFVVGPTAPKAERNILGVIGKVGLEIGGQVIKIRRLAREIINHLGGKIIHPVCGLPGGVSKGLTEEKRQEFLGVAKECVEFAQFALKIFDDVVLKNKEYVDIVVGPAYQLETYYMGMVTDDNKVEFYDGDVRVVDTEGKEFVRFKPADYLDHIAEHVESWSYIKFPFLKKIGWKGFTEGKDTSIYRVAPLARLNVSDGMRTPLAQEHYERMFATLGGKPSHHTLAFHWARLIEALQATELMVELLSNKDICDPNIRTIPTATPDEGVGIVEAPRGTLIHHYKTDKNGIIEEANLIVATIHNAPAINMSIEKAAKTFIKGGKVDDGLLNLAEMAFRPYDPCHACGTHCLPGDMPLEINIYDRDGDLVKQLKR